MCDYSLQLVSSRPAEAGETVIVTGFSGTDTRGFASPLDPNTAVCLRPATEIAFDQCARLDGRLFRRDINERLARFRQIDMDRPNLHHDALEFANGRLVLVTSLVIGQRARILQLPASDLEKATVERADEPALA